MSAMPRPAEAPSRILLFDDDPAYCGEMSRYLQAHGFAVTTVLNAADFADRLAAETPDLILLDQLLGDTTGTDVLRGLRARTDTPCIIVTGAPDPLDRVVNLELGADDDVDKSAPSRELLARIRAVLRRATPSLSEEMLRYEDLSMDLAAHRVRRSGRDIHLGPTEFRLLRHFMQHPGRVFSREQLLDLVWGHDVYVEPRTVDVHIRRLRKALNEDEQMDLIRTVRSAGYALDHKGG